MPTTRSRSSRPPTSTPCSIASDPRRGRARRPRRSACRPARLPAVTDVDVATLYILPTRLNLTTFNAQQTRVNTALQNYQAIQAAYQALPTTGTLTVAQEEVAQQASNLSKYLTITINELTAMTAIHAFLWEAGHMTDLDGANARSSAAYGINDGAQIAGVYSAAERDTAGFLYAAEKITVLTQAPHGRVSGINNAGQVVGDSAADLASARRAFLWDAGRVIELGTLGGTGSEARAINDGGQVAGSAHLDGDSAVHAFRYSGAGLTDLGTLGGKNSMAYGMNNAGEVVGAAQTADQGAEHAFLYRQGAMTDLGTLGGIDSQADGINDGGWIVGWSRTLGGVRRAFLWRTGWMVDLNSLVSAGPGIWLEEATAVNAAGEIVANASNGHAYLIALPAELR